jgi:O-antigen/teichoic acid export membrane protein
LGTPGKLKNNSGSCDAKSRLFFSFSAQILSIVSRVAVQLISIPICLRGWGVGLYQDWILICSASGFLSALDLGMQTYFGNRLLAAWSRRDHAGYRRSLATALGLYSLVLGSSVVALAVLMFLVPWPSLLGIMVLSAADVLWALSLLSAATLILIPIGLFTAVYRARGEYGLSTASGAIGEAARGLAVVLVVVCGGGPVPAAASFLLVAGVFGSVVLWDQERRYGGAPILPELPNAVEFAEAMSQSGRYLVAGLVTPILLNAPILLLGRLASATGAVVAYSVFRTLTGVGRQVVAQLSHAVGGELGHRHSLMDVSGTAALLSHAGRLVSGLGGLLCGAILVLGDPFIVAWTHGQVAYDYWLCLAFLAPIMIASPAQVVYMVYHYTNRPTILVLAGCLQVLMTLVLCLVLISPFSAAGAALACAVGECLSLGLLLPIVASRNLGMPVSRYFRDCLALAAGCFVLSIAVSLALTTLLPVRGYVDIAIIGLLWSTIVAFPAFRMLLSVPQRDWVIGQLRAGRDRFSR